MEDDQLDQALRVVAAQKLQEEELQRKNRMQASALDACIDNSLRIIEKHGRLTPQRNGAVMGGLGNTTKLRTWAEILEDAQRETAGDARVEDLLSPAEIARVEARHDALSTEFKRLNCLDRGDWCIAGLAGVLGALIDIFLVRVPRHPGFLGGPASEGGWLSNVLKDKVGVLIPRDQVYRLERAYPVPFDPSTSRGLEQTVKGLGPRTHRFQSLGHDPILGWIFGVRDLLNGEFTAIGTDGKLVIQRTTDPYIAGEGILRRLFTALQHQGGHLLSDDPTSQGLPAPLMPLLLFLQKGAIGRRDYTIGDVARQMYRSGYDFDHFLAGSIPVLVIEAIVRIAFAARRLFEGSDLPDAIPLASNPRLRSQLFLAHAIAAATNAGKIYVTQNPLSLNWAQWMALTRYLVPQLYWVVIGREEARSNHISQALSREWEVLSHEVEQLWGHQDIADGHALL